MTDVSNASRTMLMSLKTVAWDDRLCSFFGVPKEILPDIASSAEVYGCFAEGPLKGVPICGVSVAQALTCHNQQECCRHCHCHSLCLSPCLDQPRTACNKPFAVTSHVHKLSLRMSVHYCLQTVTSHLHELSHLMSQAVNTTVHKLSPPGEVVVSACSV